MTSVRVRARCRLRARATIPRLGVQIGALSRNIPRTPQPARSKAFDLTNVSRSFWGVASKQPARASNRVSFGIAVREQIRAKFATICSIPGSAERHARCAGSAGRKHSRLGVYTFTRLREQRQCDACASSRSAVHACMTATPASASSDSKPQHGVPSRKQIRIVEQFESERYAVFDAGSEVSDCLALAPFACALPMPANRKRPTLARASTLQSPSCPALIGDACTVNFGETQIQLAAVATGASLVDRNATALPARKLGSLELIAGAPFSAALTHSYIGIC